MDRTTRIKLRKLLVELYEDARKIRQVVSDAGLNAGRINLSGTAENIWHDVLVEAEKIDKIGQLVETVCAEFPEKCAELEALWGRTDNLAPNPISGAAGTAKPTPTETPLAEPSAAMTPPAAADLLNAQPPVRTIPMDLPRALRLTEIDKQLLSALFAQAAKVTVLTEFTDGLTATRVLLARPTAANGINELPAVVKLGPRSLIEPEWQATQHHILRQMPGFAAVRGLPVYLADGANEMGALCYAQVGDGVFDVESLSRYASHASVQDLWQVMANRLFRQLGELWRNTQQRASISFQQRYDSILPVNLVVALDSTAKGPTVLLDAADLAASTDEAPVLAPNTRVRLDGFVVTEISTDGRELTLDLAEQTGMAYRLRIQQPENAPPVNVGQPYPSVVGRVLTTRQLLLQSYVHSHLNAQLDLTKETVPLPDGATLPNPLLALPTLLTRRQEGWLATIHGDLNLRNILIDPAARTTHMIDCASSRQDHVLHDLLRLERDFLTDLAAQTFFNANLPPTAIVNCYRALHCACRGSTHEPGHFALPGDLDPALEKLFIVLATLRQAVRERLAVAGEWAEYYTGLVIHLLGALKYRDLDQSAPGRQPKAIAFWAAATLVDLLEHLEEQNEGFCYAIQWRPFDINGTTGRAAQALPPSSGQSRTVNPELALETLPSKGITLPANDAQPPVQRRLDVAVPAQATVQRPFLLAVAVRQNSSPPLVISELPVQHSGQAHLEWPANEPYVRLRAQVLAPECTIVGEDSYTFKLYRNLDSEVYYFSLIPKSTGRLTIIVRLYQDSDILSSTPTYTLVSEQVVGEVPMQLHSSEPVAVQPAPQRGQSLTRATDQPPIKILFLAANPLDTVRLGTDEEARAIDLALRQADYRDFAVASHHAVRIDDLQELLLRHRPDILHFSGHGASTNAIILQDAQGNSVPVRGAALGRLFRALKDNLRCVVLNACYTADNAAGLAEVIDCVVGIEDAITDTAALQFATAFYRALGYGRSVQEAFDLGQVQIELAGLGEAEALHLHENRPQAAQVRFAGASAPTVATPSTPSSNDNAHTSPAPLHPAQTSIPVKRQDTLTPGKPPTMPKRQLTPQSKMQLVNALLACPSMDDRQTRNDIVNNLSDAIKSNIKRSDTARVDLLNIVNTATNYANGLEELITWVRFYEGDSLTMQAVDQLLDA